MKLFRPSLAVLALVFASPASAVTFSCEQARWAAQTFSPETLEAWGRTLGITDAERAKALSCLAQPHTKRHGGSK